VLGVDVTDLLAARLQMALSLGFHILFAVAGIGMPLLMVLAEGWWLRTRDPVYLDLAKRWAKGTAILFAVGAVSGTVLSFELGLLWPHFMEFAGPIIGMPFSLEGFAFFFEAIFLGIYLYGWDRVSPLAHWLAGVGVWVSGTISGVFVVSANAWMNSPAGFTVDPATGAVTVDPVAAMFNPAMPGQTLHMTVAAFVTVGFLAAGVHAWALLRGPRDPSQREAHGAFHRAGLRVAFAVAAVTAVLQPLTGHVVGEHAVEAQPAKMAAAEALWETQTRAPMVVFGWPLEDEERNVGALEIPGLLSLLAKGDLDAEIIGLKDIPVDERPPVAVVHLAYQLMLGLGTAMMGVGLLGAGLWWRRGDVPTGRWFLQLLVLMAPAGAIAVEAGWTVTEVGRQPWIIYGVLRTRDAVTGVAGLQGTLVVYTLVYVVLGIMAALLLRRQFDHAPGGRPPQDAHVEVDHAA
jgi:cytochrome d ubiquinol oxidase subunit I